MKTSWRRKWQPTPVFLPGESHGQRSLAGYSPRGCKESDMTEHPHTHCPHVCRPIYLSAYMCVWFPRWLSGKQSTCNAGDPGSIPRLGRSPGEGNGNPLQYSCLDNSIDREARWATVHGAAKSWTQPSYQLSVLKEPIETKKNCKTCQSLPVPTTNNVIH